ncbi:MAG: sulfurtransferase [Pseudomonadota bacterium]
MKLLLEPAELAARLGDVAVFDCRFSLSDFDAGRRDWLAAHIPSAFHLDMETDLAGDKNGLNGRHPLPSRQALQRSLRGCGVGAGQAIVLYDDNRLAGAARAWWLLSYYGIDGVALLNGGFAAWRALDLPLESGERTRPGGGDVRLGDGDPRMLATLAQVRAASASGEPQLIDSREPPRFRGDEEPIDPVAGRIPKARNLPWQGVTAGDGTVLPAAAQAGRWHGFAAEPAPILYCGSGVTASVNALSRVLAGLEPARLYAGSFSEWCADPANPVASGDPDKD